MQNKFPNRKWVQMFSKDCLLEGKQKKGGFEVYIKREKQT